MTKKKINIVLIVVVIVLWGSVAYRSINQYFFPNQVYLTNNYEQVNFDFKKVLKDTFQLENLSRDPFLQVNSSVNPKPFEIRNPKICQIKPVVRKEKLPPVPVEWPEISYYGYIKSINKNEELIMIKVNNKLHKVKKNAELQEIKVTNVYKDSIVVKKQKETKTIFRKSNHTQNQHEE